MALKISLALMTERFLVKVYTLVTFSSNSRPSYSQQCVTRGKARSGFLKIHITNAILRRTERAMVRAMCGQKIVDRKTTEEQMDMLGLKETIDQLATANGVRWYGHVLRRDDDSVLRVALNLEVTGKRKRG